MKTKRISTIICLFLLTTSMVTNAQTNTQLDSTQFVGFYHYTIQTQDDEGQNVTDSMRMALFVGSRATYFTNIQSYNRDGRVDKEFLNAFMMHIQNVLTDMEKAKVTTLEAIYPYRYATNEPLAKIDWVITDDTMTVCGLLCHCATGGLYGKEWSVWYTEEIPSPAGPWKLRGLPGMVLKAEDDKGIFSFTFCGLINKKAPIVYMGEESHQQISEEKFIAHRNKTFCNKRYIQNPRYYIPDGALDEAVEMWAGGPEPPAEEKQTVVARDLIVPKKANKYQPLELK